MTDLFFFLVYAGGFSAFLHIGRGLFKATLWPFFLVEAVLVELKHWDDSRWENDRDA